MVSPKNALQKICKLFFKKIFFIGSLLLLFRFRVGSDMGK